MQVVVRGDLSGQYKILGQDLFTAYGHVIESAADELLQLPASKEVYSFDWQDENGKQYDLSKRYFDDKTATLSGYIMASSKEEFWTKYLAYWSMWKSPGPKTLYSFELEQTFSVFYLKSSNSKRLTRLQNYPGMIGMKLDIEIQVMFSEFVPPGVQNLPPIVGAGGDKSITLPLHELLITGASAEGQNGAIISSLQWVLASTEPAGMSAEIANGNTLTPRIFGLNTKGDYNFRLTAKDSNNLSSSALMKLTVNPAPAVPPTVNAGGDKSITLPTKELTITGATAVASGGASIDQVLWEYEASVPEGLPATVTNANSLTPRIINFERPGRYRLKLTAWDTNGNRNYDKMFVTVNQAPQNPNWDDTQTWDDTKTWIE